MSCSAPSSGTDEACVLLRGAAAAAAGCGSAACAVQSWESKAKTQPARAMCWGTPPWKVQGLKANVVKRMGFSENHQSDGY